MFNKFDIKHILICMNHSKRLDFNFQVLFHLTVYLPKKNDKKASPSMNTVFEKESAIKLIKKYFIPKK